jgi:hypothetical protein
MTAIAVPTPAISKPSASMIGHDPTHGDQALRTLPAPQVDLPN